MDGLRDKMVLNLLESVLGKGRNTARNNVSFICPFCHHHKTKLEIQLVTNHQKENPWHCWVCGEKGRTIHSLFKRLKVSSHKIDELNMLIKPGSYREVILDNSISLPKEFISLCDIEEQSLSPLERIEYNHAIKFLRNRKIRDIDILKYNIGFCAVGDYSRRIIIPSYDYKGDLNYFISRTYDKNENQHYKNPPVGRNIIGLEYYINWDAPIILVEGMFDAITIKRNVIPLFGKNISEELMKKIVSSQVNKIYIALDKDAIRESLKHCKKLMSYGKKVYLVELKDKDPNESGFENFFEIIEDTKALDFCSFLEKTIQYNT